MTIGIYTKETAVEIHKRIFGGEDIYLPSFEERDDPVPGIFLVKMFEDLEMATNPLDGWKEAKADRVRYKGLYGPSEDPRDMEDVDDPSGDFQLTIVNRSGNVFARVDDYIWVREGDNGELIPYDQEGREFDAVIATSLDVAASPLNSPSTCTFKFLDFTPGTPGTYSVSTDTGTITHRFTGISLDPGTYVKVKPHRGEWNICAADCGDSGIPV